MAGEEKASLVGDLRKLLQDIVTPILRALATRMDTLELQQADLKAELWEFKGAVKGEFRGFRGELKEEFGS